MKRLNIFLGAIVFLSFNISAQTVNRCGTVEKLNEFLQNNTESASVFHNVQDQLEHSSGFEQRGGVITIPVVVHVVYNGSAQNLSDLQVQSQIAVLNEDYRRTNLDAANTPNVFQGVAADCMIEFCLASRDPNGAPTNGIDRVSTTHGMWVDDDVKDASQGGADPWPHTSYLNIWVCDLDWGLLGYAYPPGVPGSIDGVVIGYHYFGSSDYGVFSSLNDPAYDLGRTTTHEVGHWLNLEHIWGDASCGNDNVADTPEQEGSHFGCPTHPYHVNLCGAGSSPNGEMFMNYMDYTDDYCMNMYSTGQKTRMTNAINNSRSSLLTSLGCTPPITIQLDAEMLDIVAPSGSLCSNSITPIVTLRNMGLTTLTSVTISYHIDAGSNSFYNWSGSLSTAQQINVTLPAMTTTTGSHTFTASTSNPNGSSDGNPSNDSNNSSFTVTASGNGAALPIAEGFQGAGFMPSGWTNVNPDSDDFTWEESGIGAWGASSASALFNNFDGDNTNNPDGTVDAFITGDFDFTNALWPDLKFTVAYARYDATYADGLKVYSSSDCGNSWNQIFYKFGPDLATAPDNTNSFVPSAAQWRDEIIAVPQLTGNPKVSFKFENNSGYGNNLYIDDINIYATPLGVEEIGKFSELHIYPNPSTGIFTLDLGTTIIDKGSIEIFNNIGQSVYSENFESAPHQLFSVDLSDFSSGVYFVNFKLGEQSITQKIILSK